MAAQTRQQKLVKTKIEFLFQEKDNLCQLIGDYVDQVTKLGQSWMDSQGTTGLTFSNVSDFLETSLNLLFNVGDKISEAETSPSSSSCSQQYTARLTSPTPSLSASPGPYVEEQMESLRQWMDTLETRGQSLHHVMSAAQEKVDKIEEKVDKTEEKVDKMGQKVNEMEENVKEMEEENIDEAEEERGDKIQEIEKRLSQLEEGGLRTKCGKTQQAEKTPVPGAAVGGDRVQAASGTQLQVPSPAPMWKGNLAALLNRKTVSARRRQQTGPRQPVGFKAQLPKGQKVCVIEHSTLRCLTEVTVDTGHQYNASTGVYTVPVSGRYRVTLIHSQEIENSDGSIQLSVLLDWRCVGRRRLVTVCKTITWDSQFVDRDDDQEQESTGIKFVTLKIGSQLWVNVERVCSEAKLVSPTSFSCVLVND